MKDINLFNYDIACNFFSDFSRADPLIEKYYGNPLIVDNYDYKNSPDKEVFSKIKSNFKVRINSYRKNLRIYVKYDVFT